MSAPARTVACIGIPGHERTMVRLVPEVLAQRLQHTWRTGDVHHADVVFLDPMTTDAENVTASSSQAPAIVAVVDAHASPVVRTRLGAPASTLHRPLTSEAILQALNAACDSSAPKPEPTERSFQAPSSRPLCAALHEAMTTGTDGALWKLTYADSDQILVLDPGRDRLCGAVKRLREESLTRAPTVSVTRLSVAEAEEAQLLGEFHPTPLYSLLWELGYRADAALPLFGDPRHTTFRLSRWPRTAASDLTRVELRAITLLYGHAYRVNDAVRVTGLEESTLVALLNGAWLTGDLDLVADTSAEAGQSRRPARNAAPGLLNRIRNRLASAS